MESLTTSKTLGHVRMGMPQCFSFSKLLTANAIQAASYTIFEFASTEHGSSILCAHNADGVYCLS